MTGPADPEKGYGWEKPFAGQLTAYNREECGLDVRIVRFHNIYGPLGTYAGGRRRRRRPQLRAASGYRGYNCSLRCPRHAAPGLREPGRPHAGEDGSGQRRGPAASRRNRPVPVGMATTTFLGGGDARHRLGGGARGPPIPYTWALFGGRRWTRWEDSTPP